MPVLKAIRVRFSIRLLLLITAVLSVALFLLCVRPTQVANRFVAAVLRHDFSAAKLLVMGEESVDFSEEDETVEQVYAEVLPREWEDVWKCQRKVIVRLVHQEEEDGRRVDWTSDTDLVARFNGCVVTPPLIDFSMMTCGMVELPAEAVSEPLRVPDYTLVP